MNFKLYLSPISNEGWMQMLLRSGFKGDISLSEQTSPCGYSTAEMPAHSGPKEKTPSNLQRNSMAHSADAGWPGQWQRLRGAQSREPAARASSVLPLSLHFSTTDLKGPSCFSQNLCPRNLFFYFRTSTTQCQKFESTHRYIIKQVSPHPSFWKLPWLLHIFSSRWIWQ